MCAAFSGTASATNSRVGVSRTPVCRPTSLRSTPLALSSAAAVAGLLLVVPSTV